MDEFLQKREIQKEKISKNELLLGKKEHLEWGNSFTTKNLTFTKVSDYGGVMQETMYITTVLSKTDLQSTNFIQGFEVKARL